MTLRLRRGCYVLHCMHGQVMDCQLEAIRKILQKEKYSYGTTVCMHIVMVCFCGL